MSLKAPIKFQLVNNIKSVVTFYIVLICLMIFTFILTNESMGSVRVSGIEFGTIIFLFIVGLNSFKETFMMFIQNSVSRISMFKSFIIVVAFYSVVMALLGNVILLLGKLLELGSNKFEYQGFFEQIYHRRYTSTGDFQMYLEGLLFLTFIFAAIYMLGYFITVLYYRMNRLAKIAVSVGVPIGYIVILPIADYAFLDGAINRTVVNILTFAFGFGNGQANPYYAMVSCLIAFVVLGGLSWLLMRKAVAKV